MKAKPVDLENFPLRDRTRTFDHPHLLHALEELRLFHKSPIESSFATILGATGSGKTHLVKAFKAMVEKECAKDMQDPQCLPIVYCRFRTTAGKKFNWTDAVTDLLTASGHINPRFDDLGDGRRKWINSIKQRKTLMVLIDEAFHPILGIPADDTRANRAQADVYKSLVDDTPAKLALVSSYEIGQMITVNGAAIRRNSPIHLRRYRNSLKERAQFTGVLRDMDARFSEYFDFSLEANEKLIYRECIGLIGVLRDWLVKASVVAQTSSAVKINLGHLSTARKDDWEIAAIHDDVRSSEKQFYDSKSSSRGLGDRLDQEAQQLSHEERAESKGKT